MRRWWVPVAIVMPLLFAVSSSAATAPGAVVTTKSGKTIVLKGAHCFSGRLNFGAWPYDRGKAMGILMDDRSPGRQAVVDGFIDLRPSGVHVALSGTAYVNPDRKSGRLNVWGRSGPGWTSRTGDRFTGTWRCP
jgi:hypothetical protein